MASLRPNLQVAVDRQHEADVNEWRISESLRSVRRLMEIIPEMTLDELREACNIEQGSRRRHSVMTKLTARIKAIKLAELNSQLTKEQL